jgi:hypothetical protein
MFQSTLKHSLSEMFVVDEESSACAGLANQQSVKPGEGCARPR